MPKSTEKRYIEIAQNEAGDGFNGTLLTLGDTADRGSYKETVELGAKVTIKDDAVLNRQHQRHLPVAKAGTKFLSLSNGASAVTANLMAWPETETAKEAKAQLDAGILTGLSMEYRVNEAEWAGDLRIIKDLDIVDLAMVDRPLYPESKINRAWDGFEEESPRVDPRLWL